MKIGFIGAGRVGTSIGCYFSDKGISVVGYFSRSLQSAKQASKRTKSKFFIDICELLNESDIIALTVPDDEIASVAEALSKITVCWHEKAVFHMSGVHASDMLLPLELKGASVFSMHPMLSFGDIDTAVHALQSAFFTIEGDSIILEKMKKILKQCGNICVEISTQNKALYHAAACIISNYLVTLLDVGIEMLKTAGFKYEDAIKISLPLVSNTVKNVFDLGTERALTGPIQRGDAATINRHMEELKNNKEWMELYKTLGLITVELAEKSKKIDGINVKKMKEVLIKYE